MVLLLSESDVASSLSMADGVRVVEQAFVEHATGSLVVMPRMSAPLSGEAGAFRVMTAIVPDLGFFGLKTLTGVPGRRRPGETYFAVLLFSCETGALKAVMAANRLTGIRTGAATAVAAKYLSRPDAHVLGVLGCGVQARYQVAALREVRSLDEVRVFDVDRLSAERFAEEIVAGFGVFARAVAQPRDAVAGCDLVVAVTTSQAPVLNGQWLEDGVHVTGVGANSTAKRELDATTFRNSKIVVDFKEQVLREAGDLQEALRTGAIGPDAIHAELGEVVTGRKPGRENRYEITLFKSVGMAIEDMAAAGFAYRRARAGGLGTWIELESAPTAEGAVVQR